MKSAILRCRTNSGTNSQVGGAPHVFWQIVGAQYDSASKEFVFRVNELEAGPTHNGVSQNDLRLPEPPPDGPPSPAAPTAIILVCMRTSNAVEATTERGGEM